MKLTPKQKTFVDEYLKDLNATQAAIRAGYSAKTADRIGPELLGKTCVQVELQRRQKDREHRTEITQDRVLQELAAIAFARATDYAEVTNGCVKIKDTEALTDEQTRAIAGIKDGVNGVEVKMNDKQKALELLGRHLGMWNDKLVQINKDETSDQLKNILEQLKHE